MFLSARTLEPKVSRGRLGVVLGGLVVASVLFVCARQPAPDDVPLAINVPLAFSALAAITSLLAVLTSPRDRAKGISEIGLIAVPFLVIAVAFLCVEVWVNFVGGPNMGTAIIGYVVMAIAFVVGGLITVAMSISKTPPK